MPEHVLMSEMEIITDDGRRRRWTAAEPSQVPRRVGMVAEQDRQGIARQWIMPRPGRFHPGPRPRRTIRAADLVREVLGPSPEKVDLSPGMFDLSPEKIDPTPHI
ncbi:hypothetical protein [uncultured Jannaschia sp.]|uniref:hypothetical protein n=1 Tax=uncultured Jannaschia sp. TaxID=293347 RepID=UPI00261D5FF5|nr:hypothetical protein [uncultured Jannaschia sp.]